MSDRAKRVARMISERDLLDAVVECACALGWLVHHDRPGMDRRGRWRTAIQGHPGFPDLVLVRPPRVLLVELKAERGDLTEWQNEWVVALAACPGVEVYVWWPNDWMSGEIERVLAATAPPSG